MTGQHRESLEPYLVASLLNNPAGVLDAEIAEDDFHHPLYGYVVQKMKKLYNEKQNFNLTDFTVDLRDDEVQHIRVLQGECISSLPATIRDYCLAIKQETEKRDILTAIMDIKPNMSLEEIRERLSVIGKSEKESTKIKTGADVFEEVKAALELPPACSSTGINALDDAMGGGLYEGFTYGLCGAEKSGKTTMAHTISYNLDKGGCKHLYIALEMGAQYIEQRNIGRDIGMNSLAFLNKRDAIRAKMDSLKPRENTFYLDAPGATLDEIISESSKAVVRHKVKGVIVDYWQLVQGADSRQTEEKHLRTVAQSIADFAKKNKIWVILLAQMNKEGQLFGGGGLKKACEQLYMIRTPEEAENMRWLEMDASRYTLNVNVGSESSPALVMEAASGPYFRER